MEQFFAWLGKLVDSWKAWIVIAPWDAGVRVRFGKHASLMGRPGFHWRIPYIDVIALVNTRLRFAGTPPVTVAGSSPRTSRCVTANIGFRIVNPLKALLIYGYPDSVVASRAQVEIAAGATESECRERLRSHFDPETTGIEIDLLCFVENVEVRTYRLLQAQTWMHGSGSNDANSATWRY